MPPDVNLYPNSGKLPKRVENPVAAGCKSLPKQGKTAEKGRDSQLPPVENLYPNSENRPKRVENPVAAGRKSLPKQRKTAEKGRESQCRRLTLPVHTAGPHSWLTLPSHTALPKQLQIA